MSVDSGTIVGGRYRIVRAADGGFEVEDQTTRRTRRLEFREPPDDVEAWSRRLQRGARIESGYVCEVLDSGVDGSRAFVVLPFGESLESALARGPLDLVTVDQYLRTIAQALAAGHRAGIVNGALDPRAIEIGGGAARVRYDCAASIPRFHSPEQTDAHLLSPPTDVWSLGLLAFEMLTASGYFGGDELASLYRAILLDPLVPPSERAPQLPAGFDAWFGKCVRRDAGDRYADAAAAYEGFRSIVVRDRILERRQHYVEATLGDVRSGGTAPQTCLMVARAPESEEDGATAQPCLMIITAERRQREERATSMRWAVIALITLAVIGVLVLLRR